MFEPLRSIHEAEEVFRRDGVSVLICLAAIREAVLEGRPYKNIFFPFGWRHVATPCAVVAQYDSDEVRDDSFFIPQMTLSFAVNGDFDAVWGTLEKTILTHMPFGYCVSCKEPISEVRELYLLLDAPLLSWFREVVVGVRILTFLLRLRLTDFFFRSRRFESIDRSLHLQCM